MSSLVVEVCRIDSIHSHDGADALELAQIKGWQVVVPKGKYQAEDLVTYVPIDAVIPVEQSDKWGITKYLSNGRVRCAKLRGEPSFGVVVDLEDRLWMEGDNVAEHYGITKYEAPIKLVSGDSLPEHPLFVKYTDIENLRNFPNIFEDGEEVIVTEKIHGGNCRVGMIEDELMVGSRELRRKVPQNFASNLYSSPLAVKGVLETLRAMRSVTPQVILFGEVYGSKIQNLNYGEVGSVGFRVFDLFLAGKYADAALFDAVCDVYEIPKVPILYRGPYSLAKIKELSEGQSTVGGDHIREGVVVRPVKERRDPKIGRVCLKYINDAYLFAKGITDSKDV